MTTLIAYDAREKGFLGTAWRRGAGYYARTGDFVALPVRSWAELTLGLRDNRKRINSWQLWCHGDSADAYIGQARLTFNRIKDIGRSAPWGYVWLRCCSFAADPVGKHTLSYLQTKWCCPVYAHTHIIGNLGLQSGLVCSTDEYDVHQGNTRTGGIGKKKSSIFAPNTVTALTRHPKGAKSA